MSLTVVLCLCVAWVGPLATAQSPGPPPSRAGRPAPPVPASAPADGAAEGRTRFGGDGKLSVAPLPDVSYEDLVLLVKTARRAFDDQIQGRPERPARYRPPALSNLSAVIHLAARSHGTLLASAETDEMPVVDAAVAGGVLLGRAILDSSDTGVGRFSKKLATRDGGRQLGLELELLGPREYIAAKYNEEGVWTDELLHAFDPAAEGIGVELRGKRGWTRPSRIVALNYTPDLALQAAESAMGLTLTHKLRVEKEIRYFRFRAYHLWQPSRNVLPVVLLRGEELVSAEPMGPEVLDAAIDRMGLYLRYRQNRDGWFSQEYLPGRDRYGTGNSVRVQMDAQWGLAAYAAWSGRSDILAGAKHGIAMAASFLNPLSVVEGVDEEGEPRLRRVGLALSIPGHGHHLEISAKLLLAFQEVSQQWGLDSLIREPPVTSSPHHEVASSPRGRRLLVASDPHVGRNGSAPSKNSPQMTVGDCIRGLAGGLLACQDEEGRLRMGLQAADDTDGEAIAAAGWALLALASTVQAAQAPQVERSLQRALSHYRSLKDQLGPEEAAALVRALSLGYVLTNDARASDFVFEILDRFARIQVVEENCPCPELYGAINARRQGVIGIDTALYLSALADGLVLAERVGDKARAERYRGVILRAVRFILQLEVREAGCYYIRSPRDALGGVRTAPWNHRIRADHCAAAVRSLIRARTALYGPRVEATKR